VFVANYLLGADDHERVRLLNWLSHEELARSSREHDGLCDP
jgi:hypothetical protein